MLHLMPDDSDPRTSVRERALAIDDVSWRWFWVDGPFRDVSGAGVPVAAAGALPLDSDRDVDSEHPRQHRGG